MIKKIRVESIEKAQEYGTSPLLTREEIEKAIGKIVEQVRCNMNYFGTGFPTPATKDDTYGIIDNVEWTNGFWTGMLWLCYEYTGDEEFRLMAEQNITSFLNRVEKRLELDHHDLGFLYIPSCVAGYKLTGSEDGKKAGMMAADKLMERYQEKGGFIQAWGVLGARDDYRLIIDCLLNIPLLYWASEVTGNNIYESAAPV